MFANFKSELRRVETHDFNVTYVAYFADTLINRIIFLHGDWSSVH